MRQAHSFDSAFGKKQTRKRPKIVSEDYAQLLGSAEDHSLKYEARESGNDDIDDGVSNAARQKLFEKGQSRRIWSELYKVIDSSDVIIQVRSLLVKLLFLQKLTWDLSTDTQYWLKLIVLISFIIQERILSKFHSIQKKMHYLRYECQEWQN